MANVKQLQRSFNGGELSPEMFGLISDAKYASGLQRMRNFIAMPHGPAANRAGTAFVRSVKTPSKKTRLLPFSFSPDQTFVIELGAGYFRFHTAGATVMNGGSPYEVANSYDEADLFDICFEQSNDVLTLTHRKYPPAELRRLGATNWQFSDIVFGSSLGAPTGQAATATTAPSPTGLVTYSYKISAVGEVQSDESATSAAATCSNNLLQTGAYNTVSWSAVTNAKRYNVYKESNGLYGYIGQTDGTSFKDDNITADIGKTPPEGAVPFYPPVSIGGSGSWPAAVSYYEQRRCFAGTYGQPQSLWMTRSGTEKNLTYSIPARDDDAISVKLSARDLNQIRHIVPLSNLVLLTNSAEWRVTSVSSDAITPTSISLKPQSYVGASSVRPIIVNNSMLFCAARGGHVRELAYNWQANGFVTGDLSLRSQHLFDGLTIVDSAYSKAPVPICWFVSSNGRLLGLTYVPEQQIGAWHWHDTEGGYFESVAAVAEGEEDVLYAVVRRTIGGAVARYVERMAGRVESRTSGFFVDSGLTYSGAPASTISGLGHLEGKEVAILGDGAVRPRKTVTGGQVTLDRVASLAIIGLPITADLQTMPVVAQIDAAFGAGRTKNVNKAWLRAHQSAGFHIGPDFEHLTEAKWRTNEPYGSAPELKTVETQLPISPSWGSDGAVCVRHADPLPLKVVSLTLEVAIGG